MSESPGGAFIDQFKNWSILLSYFPVSRKGKYDAGESLTAPGSLRIRPRIPGSAA